MQKPIPVVRTIYLLQYLPDGERVGKLNIKVLITAINNERSRAQVCCNNIIINIVSFSLKSRLIPPPPAEDISQRFILPSNSDI